MKHYNQKTDFQRQRGFTLVEIMIVVVIIGILAAIAIPSFGKVKISAQNTRILNDFRIFSGAFEQYSLENGAYPPDGGFNLYPVGMEEYLGSRWENAPFNGQWIWDQDDRGIIAGVSLRNSSISAEQMLQLDIKADDGDLDAGRLRRIAGDRLTWVIE